MKEKCLKRLSDQRKSLISKYRRDIMQYQYEVTESSKKIKLNKFME